MTDDTAACPICGSTSVEFAYRKGPATYQKCRTCKLLYQSPLPTAEQMRAYAESEYESGRYADYVRARGMKLATFRRRLERIRKLVPSGRLLDVGCAAGFMIDAALEGGYDAFGIEFSDGALAYASGDARPRISIGDVESFRLEQLGKFDVVTAFDIVEHSHDPIALLQRLSQLLSQDGLLVVSTPDAGHFLRYVMGSKWPHLQPMQHTFLFSQRSMRTACQHADLEVVEVRAAKKVLSVAYLATQVEELNPGVYRAFEKAKSVIPAAIAERPIGIDIGEMLVFARPATSDAPPVPG